MPDLPQTVTEATETDEKMIPLSAVEPLMEAVAQMIARGQPMQAELLLGYDRAAKAAGLITSAGICRGRSRAPIYHHPRSLRGQEPEIPITYAGEDPPCAG